MYFTPIVFRGEVKIKLFVVGTSIKKGKVELSNLVEHSECLVIE